MASMFSRVKSEVHLLDPGAGVGSLTAAFVELICSRGPKPTRLTAVAYEVDDLLLPELHNTMSLCATACQNA